MITITDYVKTWLTQHPGYVPYVQQGVINYSSLARRMKDDIEQQAGERVSVAAVTLALNRYAKRLSGDELIDYEQYIGEVSVQSGLGILAIAQTDLDSDTFFWAVKKLHDRHEYMVYTRGIWHTALIGRSEVIDELATTLHGTITSTDLVGVTIKLKKGHLPVPGVCAYVLQLLAARDVNLVEVTSSHDELTVFVPSQSLGDTLECLIRV